MVLKHRSNEIRIRRELPVYIKLEFHFTIFGVLQCQKTILQVSVDWHYFIRDPFCFASLVILAYLIKRCVIRDGKSQFSVLQLFYIIIRVLSYD